MGKVEGEPEYEPDEIFSEDPEVGIAQLEIPKNSRDRKIGDLLSRLEEDVEAGMKKIVEVTETPSATRYIIELTTIGVAAIVGYKAGEIIEKKTRGSRKKKT